MSKILSAGIWETLGETGEEQKKKYIIKLNGTKKTAETGGFVSGLEMKSPDFCPRNSNCSESSRNSIFELFGEEWTVTVTFLTARIENKNY